MPVPAPLPSAPAYSGYQALYIGLDQGLATVTINHPPLNLLDSALITELMRFVAAVGADEQVRVIGTEASVRAAVARQAVRASGLAARLSGA